MESDRMNLWNYFHDPKTGHGSIKSHLLILYSIALGMKAKVIIEVGMKQGDSTRALLAAAQQTDGKVYSIDNLRYPETLEMIEKLGFDEHHVFVHKSSVQAAKEWQGACIDLLLLDAGHRYEEHEEDFNAWKNHVKEGGIILIHDIDPTMPHHDGYNHFLKEVIPNYESVALMFGGGLGIIRRV